MSVATVSADGQPSSRTVLLKFYDQRGFVFYTNLGSRKAKEIEANPKVALLFFWPEIHRQVKIRGSATRTSAAESLSYFLRRPRDSQLGAWVSNQSQAISSRAVLEQKFNEMKQKFSVGEVPLPSFWGGYRVSSTQSSSGRARRAGCTTGFSIRAQQAIGKSRGSHPDGPPCDPRTPTPGQSAVMRPPASGTHRLGPARAAVGTLESAAIFLDPIGKRPEISASHRVHTDSLQQVLDAPGGENLLRALPGLSVNLGVHGRP